MNLRRILRTFPLWIIILTLGLLSLFAWQAAPVASGQDLDTEQVALTPVATSTMSDEWAADIHPADRKFFRNGYVIGTETMPIAYASDNVHPADRTFFYNGPAELYGTPAGRHPADRKFFTPTYGDGD